MKIEGFDHPLWRLFYWWIGFRRYWVADPDRDIQPQKGRFVKYQGEVRKINFVWTSDKGAVDLNQARTPNNSANETSRVPLTQCTPVERIFMHKDQYAAVCRQPYAAWALL